MDTRTVATESGRRRNGSAGGCDWRSLSLAVLGLLLIAARIAAAQDGARIQPDATFRSTVDLVTLHVTVRDDSGGYLSDLEAPEFKVFEDGRPQQLRVFEAGGFPVAVMLLLDISSSMNHVFAEVQQAAIQFLKRLGPRDVASVVAFGDGVEILHTFTADHEALERAVRQAKALGSTGLYNALYVGLKELSKSAADDRSIPRRSVAVLLTDGLDTASLVSFDQVLDIAKRSDIAIYAIRLKGTIPIRNDSMEAEFVLNQLTRQTGGRAFLSVREARDLRPVYDDIRAELGGQYAIGYVSNDTRRDGRYRYLAVQLTRAGARARTRLGYFAPRALFGPHQR